ncbi:O-antigen ligase family protein [Kerstersia similis]|uniref:O-antigen ligase family protein n=1 Tax=Kerstersia similis TaxID=206505 RepID=UPI0039EF1314
MGNILARYYFPFIIYLVFSVGGVIPLSVEDPLVLILSGFVFVNVVGMGFIYFRDFKKERVQVVFLFFFISFLVSALGLLATNDLVVSFEKINGAVFCSVVISVFWVVGVRRYGEHGFLRSFLFVMFAFFVLTVLYKMQMGFGSRSVRFFINGPIVYGWLMALGFVLAFHCWSVESKISYLILALVFLFGVFWTESKGALAALAFSLCVYFFSYFRKNIKYFLFLGFSLLAIFFVFGEQISAALDGSRLQAVSRIFSGDLGESDYGSIGVRSELINAAVASFLDSPMLGIGMGNFSYQQFFYPHNQHLELFAEFGFFVGVLHVLFIVYAICRSNSLYRVLIILFSISASFSGDASYLRFVYAFCMIGLMLPVRKS